MEKIFQKLGRIREHLTLVRSIEAECLERFTMDPGSLSLFHFSC
jgi:hypothetical protein